MSAPSADASVTTQAAIFLAAAVTIVPVFKRLGLGAVLGYLAAGVLIGPSGFAWIHEVESVLHLAEFGVVFFLFTVGLEIQPSRLWEMRRIVFGLGGAQMGLTAAAAAAIGIAAGLAPGAAVIAGIGLALSSTAIALQLLSERNQLAAPHGRTAFGILLFQDIAVIPVIAMLPLLSPEGAGEGGIPWLRLGGTAALLVGLIVLGPRMIRPVLRWVAGTKSQELFTATTLLVVVGTALLMSGIGLSMALGTFLAGVLLSDSEYRHELEADIEPFKGLLLGLFFIAVGMAMNLSVFRERPLLIAGFVGLLLAGKAAILFGIARLRGHEAAGSATMALAAAQGGEFAFVLFALAADNRVLTRETAELLVIVVSASMAASPILLVAWERLGKRLLAAPEKAPEYDTSIKDESPVIIAGFGRVGQVVGRLLRAKRFRFTALDASSEHVDFIRKFGNKTFYGDASRLDLLRAARADAAKIFVVAVDDVEASMRIVESVQRHFPHLKIIARARNRQHAYRLLEVGVPYVFRETMGSSLDLTGAVLRELGIPADDASTMLARFKAYDESLLMETYQHRKDMAKLTEMAQKATKDLEELFERDASLEESAARATGKTT